MREAIARHIVRWENKANGVGRVLDAALPTVEVNPESDEPIAPYVRIEEIA